MRDRECPPQLWLMCSFTNRKQCCFEIDTSEMLVNEVWRRMDSGEAGADFRSVVEDLNLRVLIL